METISRPALQKTKVFCRNKPARGGTFQRGIYNSAKCAKCKSSKVGWHIGLKDVMSLIAAIQYGAQHYPDWRGITINLTMLDAPQATETTLRVLMDHLRHWQEQRGAPPYWAWVREQGARHGDHVHILAAAPNGTGRSLSAALSRWLRGQSIRGDVTRGTLHTRQTTPTGWLEYACKTLTPADAATIFAQTGLRIAPEKPGGPVIGQRRGIARRLGPKARETSANPL